MLPCVNNEFHKTRVPLPWSSLCRGISVWVARQYSVHFCQYYNICVTTKCTITCGVMLITYTWMLLFLIVCCQSPAVSSVWLFILIVLFFTPLRSGTNFACSRESSCLVWDDMCFACTLQVELRLTYILELHIAAFLQDCLFACSLHVLLPTFQCVANHHVCMCK